MIQSLISQVSWCFDQGCQLTATLASPFISSNEITFITHSLLIGVFALSAVRLGRGALTAFMAVCWVLGSLFVIKQATIFNLNVTTTDSFAIGANIAITLLQEHYGQKAAKNGIAIGFFIAFFFLIMSLMQLVYIPNAHDTVNPHFIAILSSMPRIIISSFFVAAISIRLNLILFQLFEKRFGRVFFALNAFLALTLSQLLDTALFSFFALYGSVESIIPIIFFSSLVKTISIGLMVPAVTLAKHFLKKHTEL